MKTITLLLLAFALNASGQNTGRALFESKCATCHGKDGARGWFGAKNLRKGLLTDGEYFNIISNGKRVMPTWKRQLDSGQIVQIISYIKTFRQ